MQQSCCTCSLKKGIDTIAGGGGSAANSGVEGGLSRKVYPFSNGEYARGGDVIFAADRWQQGFGW